MKTTKILSAMLTGAMLIGASSFTVSAEANSVPEAVDGVVTLTEDVTVSTYTINQDLVLNLNGCTLDAAVRIDNGAENVTIKNGSLTCESRYNTSAEQEKNFVLILAADANLTLQNVKLNGEDMTDEYGIGGVRLEKGGEIMIEDSEISAGNLLLVNGAAVNPQESLYIMDVDSVTIKDSTLYGGDVVYSGGDYTGGYASSFFRDCDSTVALVRNTVLNIEGSNIYGSNNDIHNAGEAVFVTSSASGAIVNITDSNLYGGNAAVKNKSTNNGIGGDGLRAGKNTVEIVGSKIFAGGGNSWGGDAVVFDQIADSLKITGSLLEGSVSGNGDSKGNALNNNARSGILNAEISDSELSASPAVGDVTKGNLLLTATGEVKTTGTIGENTYFLGEGSVLNRETEQDGYTEVADRFLVASIGSDAYTTLEAAVNAATDGDTVKLLSDVTLDDYLIFNKNITLDLDGHTLTSNYVMGTTRGENYAIRFTAGGTITDSAAEKGELVATKARAVNAAGGVLTLKDATVRVTDDGVSSGNAVIGTNNGLVMTNSKVYGDFTGSYAVCSFGKVEEKIRISDSVIFGTHMGFYRNGSAGHLDMTVKNSEITSNDYAVYISNHKGNLKNGEIYFHDVSFTDTTVKGQLGIEVKYTNLTLEDCDVTATGTPSFAQNNNGPEANGFVVVVTDNSVNDEKAEPMGTITIKSGNYQGLIGLENLPEAKAYMADDVKNDVRISGGTFSTDVSAYTAPGFAAKKVGDKWIVDDSATELTLGFKKTATDERVYDIVVTAADETKINRLNTAELTFNLTATSEADSTVTYEILPVTDITVTPDNENTNLYMFNFNGKDGVTDTANEITVGQVRFEGYTKNGATITFKTDMANSFVTATTKDGENVVTYFDGNGTLKADTVNKIENVKFAVPTKKLTVNITFPNAIADQKAAYQDMKVVISGGDLAENLVYKLGTGEGTTALEGGAYKLVVDGKLTENTAYTVTVSGAGYRTARYTVTMTVDKVLNFWNNVKDTPAVVEEGKDASKKSVTFLAGDIVKDGKINIYDLSAVVSYFGTINDVSAESAYAKYDLNRDGKIDSKDVAYVLVSWGK